MSWKGEELRRRGNTEEGGEGGWCRGRGGAAKKAWGVLPRATRRGAATNEGKREEGEEGREGEDDVEEGGDCDERRKREEGSGKGGNCEGEGCTKFGLKKKKEGKICFEPSINPLISYRNRINILDIKRFID